MTLHHDYALEDSSSESVHTTPSRVQSREASRDQKLKYDKWDHMSAIYYKLDQSMSRTASYLREEQAATAARRAKKRVTRAHKQTSSITPVERQQALTQAKPHKTSSAKPARHGQVKSNTAHSTPDVDPVTGLTWQERRVERQHRRREQQQQLSHEWAEKMDILMEANVPERLILPLLRKYEGDVSAVLAYHAGYHQQRVHAKHHAQQQRIKKSYADTTLVRSGAAEQAMLAATDPTLSQHLQDLTLV